MSVSEQVGEELVHHDGHDEDHPGGDVPVEGLDPGKGQPIVHHADDEYPDQRGDDPPLAAVQARPPDDDRRNGKQLKIRSHRDEVSLPGLEDPYDARHPRKERGENIDTHQVPARVDSRPDSRVDAAANGIGMLPETRVLEEVPQHDEEREGQEEHIRDKPHQVLDLARRGPGGGSKEAVGMQGRVVVVDIAVADLREDVGKERNGEAAVAHVERDPVGHAENPEGGDEGGHAEPRHEDPAGQATGEAGGQAGNDAQGDCQPGRPVYAELRRVQVPDHPGAHDRGKPHHVAHGEVDSPGDDDEGLRESEEQGRRCRIEDGLDIGDREEVLPREEEDHDHDQEKEDRPVAPERPQLAEGRGSRVSA